MVLRLRSAVADLFRTRIAIEADDIADIGNYPRGSGFDKLVVVELREVFFSTAVGPATIARSAFRARPVVIAPR